MRCPLLQIFNLHVIAPMGLVPAQKIQIYSQEMGANLAELETGFEYLR